MPAVAVDRLSDGRVRAAVPGFEGEDSKGSHAATIGGVDSIPMSETRIEPPAAAAPGPPPGSDEAMAPLCAVFRRYLKSQRLKYTPERAAILDAIIARDAVFEAEDLIADIRDGGFRVSKATIYRTIKLLQDAGIITQALFDSRQSYYRLIYGRAQRDYIVCMRTGRVIEFTDPELERVRERICREHGLEPVAHRFQIYAISDDDADAASQPAADA